MGSRRVGFGMSVLRIRLEIENEPHPPYRLTVGDLLDWFKAADPNSEVFAEDGFISIVPVVEE